MKKFKKAVIIGPGLIGASLGMILRKEKIADSVIGVARRKSTVVYAKKIRAIDLGLHDIKKAVIGADLVILATPVATIKKIIRQIKDKLKKNCIVFDVGSTKKEIVRMAEQTLPKSVKFVGTHPMAGSEKTGPGNATDTLFRNSICFVVKTSKTNTSALNQVIKIWQRCSAKPVIINSVMHDKIVAQISHLPHLIAAAVVNSVQDDFLKFAATGFKDTTRVVSGDPGIWSEIAFSNRALILKSIGRFEKKLAVLKKSLKGVNQKKFRHQLSAAKTKRDTVCKTQA